MTTFTEAEARTKICVHLSGSKCIASGCMAWRYHTVRETMEGIPTSEDWKPSASAGWWHRDVIKGHCGLAGKP